MKITKNGLTKEFVAKGTQFMGGDIAVWSACGVLIDTSTTNETNMLFVIVPDLLKNKIISIKIKDLKLIRILWIHQIGAKDLRSFIITYDQLNYAYDHHLNPFSS